MSCLFELFNVEYQDLVIPVKGQSRSVKVVTFVRLGSGYGFLLVFYINFAPIFDFKKCHDLEMGVKGHSRSLRVVSFDRLCMVYY